MGRTRASRTASKKRILNVENGEEVPANEPSATQNDLKRQRVDTEGSTRRRTRRAAAQRAIDKFDKLEEEPSHKVAGNRANSKTTAPKPAPKTLPKHALRAKMASFREAVKRDDWDLPDHPLAEVPAEVWERVCSHLDPVSMLSLYSIDVHMFKMGEMHVVQGQPLRPLLVRVLGSGGAVPVKLVDPNDFGRRNNTNEKDAVLCALDRALALEDEHLRAMMLPSDHEILRLTTQYLPQLCGTSTEALDWLLRKGKRLDAPWMSQLAFSERWEHIPNAAWTFVKFDLDAGVGFDDRPRSRWGFQPQVHPRNTYIKYMKAVQVYDITVDEIYVVPLDVMVTFLIRIFASNGARRPRIPADALSHVLAVHGMEGVEQCVRAGMTGAKGLLKAVLPNADDTRRLAVLLQQCPQEDLKQSQVLLGAAEHGYNDIVAMLWAHVPSLTASQWRSHRTYLVRVAASLSNKDKLMAFEAEALANDSLDAMQKVHEALGESMDDDSLLQSIQHGNVYAIDALAQRNVPLDAPLGQLMGTEERRRDKLTAPQWETLVKLQARDSVVDDSSSSSSSRVDDQVHALLLRLNNLADVKALLKEDPSMLTNDVFVSAVLQFVGSFHDRKGGTIMAFLLKQGLPLTQQVEDLAAAMYDERVLNALMQRSWRWRTMCGRTNDVVRELSKGCDDLDGAWKGVMNRNAENLGVERYFWRQLDADIIAFLEAGLQVTRSAVENWSVSRDEAFMQVLQRAAEAGMHDLVWANLTAGNQSLALESMQTLGVTPDSEQLVHGINEGWHKFVNAACERGAGLPSVIPRLGRKGGSEAMLRVLIKHGMRSDESHLTHALSHRMSADLVALILDAGVPCSERCRKSGLNRNMFDADVLEVLRQRGVPCDMHVLSWIARGGDGNADLLCDILQNDPSADPHTCGWLDSGCCLWRNARLNRVLEQLLAWYARKGKPVPPDLLAACANDNIDMLARVLETHEVDVGDFDWVERYVRPSNRDSAAFHQLVYGLLTDAQRANLPSVLVRLAVKDHDAELLAPTYAVDPEKVRRAAYHVQEHRWFLDEFLPHVNNNNNG